MGIDLVAPTRVDAAPRSRCRFEVSGLVQGVGFRPFVYAAAAELGLTGLVANTARGVTIEVEGEPAAVATFGRRLVEAPPPLAHVTAVTTSPVEPRGGTGFTIEVSDAGGPLRTLASPDVALCADCRAELADPTDRRHRHPFISCTNCGPRFTIMEGLPYDRSRTTMAGFPLCSACAEEYADPHDRRFHAQPVACHDCGPRVALLGKSRVPVLRDREALEAARVLLAEGAILAVKGLGGYHLACDARNETTVAELRRRKGRGDKPFAVMARDLDTVRRLVDVDGPEVALLSGPRAPILLLPKRPTPHPVAGSVAPGNPDLGVLLPYTPLHALLVGLPGDDAPDVLVMTSANLSGEPMVTDDHTALTSLEPLVDAWLVHDRRIRVPCDDSVARFVGGAELPIRRSRGYAPLPLALPYDVEPVLAVGADLKNTCAVASGRYAWVSQHVGDLDDLATLRSLESTASHLETLTGVRPTRLVVDAHPAYRSRRWAHQQARGRPVRTVQHHHAHVASVMGEHGLALGAEVIGFAFDGTGYGTDGAVWGGELLVAGYRSFRRAAHLAYVPLAGGDTSVRRPYRMALAHLWAAGVAWDEDIAAVAACPRVERGVLEHQLRTGLGCVPTSSIGRLFDAVSSLVGVRHVVDYEAEAAIDLEALARTVDDAPPYGFDLQWSATSPTLADPAPLVRSVVADLRAGTPAAVVAARFHSGVAALVAALAEREREATGLDDVVLSGGVFQNSVLLAETVRRLEARRFTVLRPRQLPANDGGIALGQLLVAAADEHPHTQPKGDHPCV